jgi:hypothetical protein
MVDAGERGGELAAVLVGEQQVLAGGEDVVERAEQPVPLVRGVAAADPVGRRCRFDRQVGRLLRGQAHLRLQRPIDRLPPLGESVHLADGLAQARSGCSEASIGGAQLMHGDGVVDDLTSAS